MSEVQKTETSTTHTAIARDGSDRRTFNERRAEKARVDMTLKPTPRPAGLFMRGRTIKDK